MTAGQTSTKKAGGIGFRLYLLFVVSWFLHIPARIPVLGALRVDLILVVILAILISRLPSEKGQLARHPAGKWLGILLAYSILAVPFTEWPGTVIKLGVPNLMKAAVFYYFTISFIRTERDLRLFVVVFLGCQTLRVLEPLYLHLTQGYWGSAASMEGGSEFLSRLSGAPDDVVNPNGLASIICTILPFLYFTAPFSWKNRCIFLLLAPLLLYALVLTGSRSGLLAFGIGCLGAVIKSKKPVLLGASIVLVAFLSVPYMSTDLQDRYLSIVGRGKRTLRQPRSDPRE